MGVRPAVAAAAQEKLLDPGPPLLLPAEQAWLVQLPAPPSAGGVFDLERVYIPLESDQTVALVRETGAVAWTAAIGSAFPPGLADGLVLMAASDDLYALDAVTGATIWRTPLPRALAAPLAVAGELLIAPVEPGEILALHASDGRVAWRHPLPASPLSGAVASTEGGIVLSLADARVRAIAASDGRLLWDRMLAGTLSVPAVARDRVFVGSTDNFFYALDAGNGRIRWRSRSGGDVIGAAADDDLVYVASLDNMLRALNRGNGNQRWKQGLALRPTRPPDAAERLVWLTASSATLAAFNAETGAATGTYDMGSPQAPAELQGAPLVDPLLRPFGVAAVLVTRDGRVVGLRPVAMMFREPPAAPLSALPGRPLPRERRP